MLRKAFGGRFKIKAVGRMQCVETNPLFVRTIRSHCGRYHLAGRTNIADAAVHLKCLQFLIVIEQRMIGRNGNICTPYRVKVQQNAITHAAISANIFRNNAITNSNATVTHLNAFQTRDYVLVHNMIIS